jgi:hypothetical protein
MRRIGTGLTLAKNDGEHMATPKASSTLAQAFVALLPEPLKPHVTDEPRIILRIPAKVAEVGDLTVHDNGKELTVYVGRIDHRHFEAYCEAGRTQREQEQQAAEGAVQWVQAILGDRVRFRNQFKAGRLIAGSSWLTEHQEGGPLLEFADEVREYTWNGKKMDEHRKE